MSPNSYIAQLKRLAAHRSYRRLLVGGGVSALGDRIGYIAFLAAVTSQSTDAMAIGGITISEMLPALITAPVVSLIIDRYDRRRLMVVADIARSIVFACAAIWPEPVMLYIAAFLSASFTQLFEPCRQALEPHYVPEGELTQAGGIRMGMMSLVLVVGPSLGGVIVALSGFRAAFAIDAISFLVSAWMVWDLDKVEIKERVVTGKWSEIMGGIHAIRENSVLVFLFGMLGAFYLVIGIQFPLIFLFVKEQLHGGPRELGWLLSGIGIGGLLGGAWLASLKKGKNPFDSAVSAGRRNLALIVVFDGVIVVVFSMMHSLLPTIILFTGFGFVGTTLHTAMQASLAAQTEDHVRGRVSSVFSVLAGTLIVASIAIGTPYANKYGSATVMEYSGLLEVAAGVAALAFTGWGSRRREAAIQAL